VRDFNFCEGIPILSVFSTQNPDCWQPTALEAHSSDQWVIGQLGQSLDGQIATATGHSKYINGEGGLRHLHTLRAWADAVVVGVGSVVADDPKLTVRLVNGHHPIRLILDPNGRVPGHAALLNDQAARTVVMTAEQTGALHLPAHVEVVRLALDADARLPPSSVLRWAKQAGCQRVLVEGGPATLAGFIAAGCIDYLHLLTSPVLLGSGKSGIVRPELLDLAQAQRFRAKAYRLDQDLLIECDLRGFIQGADSA